MERLFKIEVSYSTVSHIGYKGIEIRDRGKVGWVKKIYQHVSWSPWQRIWVENNTCCEWFCIDARGLSELVSCAEVKDWQLWVVHNTSIIKILV